MCRTPSSRVYELVRWSQYRLLKISVRRASLVVHVPRLVQDLETDDL